jgi:APA family basic amino acid/polyamine antiporter
MFKKALKSPESSVKLHRTLGLPMLTFYGTGMILGAGIYSIVGKAAGVAGEGVWLSLLFAAIAAILTALSYAELSAMFPRVGGEFVYLKEAFPKSLWVASSGGLMMAFAGITTSSTVALAFAGYVQEFISFSPLLMAFILLAIFTAVNILGIRESSWTNLGFTLIEISGLIIFIYFGIQSPLFGEALLTSPTLATLSGSSLIIFAYLGFENIVNFAEETKNPEKTLPRAILLSIGVSTVLYILVALSAVSLLPINELLQSAAPLSDAIRPLSPRVAGVIAGIALFATANTVLISLVTTSRILFGMARESAIPKKISLLSKTRKTPWVAAILSFVVASALLPLGKVEVLASISSFATVSAFVLVNIALILLRFKRPLVHRPFVTPWSIKSVPVLPILGVITSLLLLIHFDVVIYQVGGGFLFLIILFQIIMARLKTKKTLPDLDEHR